jgi:hypothetical protein
LAVYGDLTGQRLGGASNLDTAIETYRKLHEKEPELTDEEEITLKIEEAACWYRVIDELAWRYIRDKRDLFADYFLDSLADLLALQGASPDFICGTIAKRSEEYAGYKEWVSSTDQGMRDTLLWEAAKYVSRAIGIDHDPIFWVTFGACLLDRVKRGLIYELLTGKQREGLPR